MKASVSPTGGDPIGVTPPQITTKIRIPRRPAALLPRHRLVNFIHTHLDRKLVLVSAPAGYGKTSLLVDFAHDTDLPVCWYTLDPFDRDLRVFFEHLVSAIALRFPAFGERSRALLRGITDPARNLYPLVATLVQEIHDTIPEYFVLILDDHHAIEDHQQINEFLDLLLTYVGENCHLILASRALPALPHFPTLVAGRQASGLGLAALRFTPQEVQDLARQNYGLELALDEASKLVERTDGWITGLLLSVAPHWERTQEKLLVHGQINVGLYDYLSQQVLDTQAAPLRDFLLASSVLDELNPQLCSAVLEVEASAAFMEELRTRNLFVVGFEGEDDRLRYHDLFREFLRTTLRRQDPTRYRNLTHRTAQICAAQGEWDRAVSRYLELQEYEQAVEIIDQTATHMYEIGRWDTLAGWIDALPPAILAACPRLLVHRGKIHADRAEYTAAMALYDRAEEAFAAAGDKAWVAYTLVTRGSLLRLRGRYADAISQCHKAMSLIGGARKRERFTLALAHRNIGLCQLRLGEPTESQESLRQALRLYEALGNAHDVAMTHHDLGLGSELTGDLDRALDHYQAGLRHWRQLDNPSPWANTLNGLGVVYHLQGRLGEASETLNEALAKARQAGDLRVEALALASLGDLHRDLGAYSRAQEAYTEGLKAAVRVGGGFIFTYTLDALGNMARLQGSLVQARKRLQQAMEHAQDHDSPYEIGLCHTSLGILEREDANQAAARCHLDRAIELLEAGSFKRELARALLHRAQVSFLAEERDEALADLERALALVDQLGSGQFLVLDCLQLQPMLRFAHSQGVGAHVLPGLLERVEARQSFLARQPEPAGQVEPRHMLKICALGPPSVQLDGETVRWATLQSRNLLFCLLQNRQGLSKERVGYLLWPDHESHRLHSMFHSTLYRLRRALFAQAVVYEDERYRFDRETEYWFDVEEFERLLDQARQEQDRDEVVGLLDRALALYQGEYLQGVYGDWCRLDRERLQERYLAALESLAGLYLQRGSLPQAIARYQRLLAQDRFREVAHRGLMRCYHLQGDRAAAIRQYQTCVETLREELGLDPMPDTEELYLQIIG